jgi:pimeloyl-ACP methyl ester carboxylesterase
MVLSGGGIAPRAQEVFRARAEAAAAGLPADAAARLMELKWSYGATGEGWEAYVAAVAAADPRTAAIVETPTEPDPSRWALLRALAGHDPLPDLGAIRVPTLVVFGAEDDNVPVDRAAAIWHAAVRASLLTLETVPGAGHALVGQRAGMGSVFPAPFVATVDRWLGEHVRGAGR